MDLRVFSAVSNVYFIHFIDLFTHFTKAKMIRSKKLKVVVEAFIITWIASGMGAPNKVLVDNGGEFDNKEYVEAMEQYSIDVCATGTYSPCNGTCERNHAMVDMMVYKMLEESPKPSISKQLFCKEDQSNEACILSLLEKQS